jgi:hypothetical protein
MRTRDVFGGCLVLFLFGCGSSTPPKPSVDEYVQKKIDAMTKIAEAVDNPNQEFEVRNALRKFRDIPFQAKTQPEAAKKILDIYEARVKGNVRGDAAIEVAGEMDLIADQLK